MYDIKKEKQDWRAEGMRSAFLGGLLLWVCVFAGPAANAQQLQALARLEASRSSIRERFSGDVDITLKLTQAVPYRVFTLGAPYRLVIDFREVGFEGLDGETLIGTDAIKSLRFGVFRPGWSRMVLELAQPMRLFSSEMETDATRGDAVVRIRLTPVGKPEFDAGTGIANIGIWADRQPANLTRPKKRPQGDRPVVIAIDPGHGGIDPGARYQGLNEADLMLTLAREAKEKLIMTGRYEVFLTRGEDVFMSLQGRVSAARTLGADVFLSFHADALLKGKATGTTVYTLSENASDGLAAALAAGHERSDLLAGVDLAMQDDLIAAVLMDMARVETTPRSEKLADQLVAGIAGSVGKIRSRPRLSAGFSVLKAPDIPSVLIEFGFMSNPSDLNNLTNASWRQKVIRGLTLALDRWSVEDAAQAKLLRQ